MDLLKEESQKVKEKNTKKIIIVFIVLLTALLMITIILIAVFNQLEKNREKLVLNGKKVANYTDMLIRDEITGNVYIPIETVAKLTGYQFYYGGYKEYTEDKTKCYTEDENQVAMFEEGSNVIYKSATSEKLNFENHIVNAPVKVYNNMLCATPEALNVALNVKFSYNSDEKTLYLQTLSYLVNYYKNNISRYGYTGIAEDFKTQKVVSYGLLVAQKDSKFGVVSTQDLSSVIIGTKYDKMEFLEASQEFLVTSAEKQGIIAIDGETRIGLNYDYMGLIDPGRGLYYAINDELVGVLNRAGKVLVFIEYDKIGIDRDLFPLNNIKNNLFIYDNCIPLCKDDKWGLADKNGNIILNFSYDSLGFVNTAKDKSINNTVVIPYIGGIVIGKNEKYGVANSIGKVIIPCEFDKIYSITSEGKDEFYLEQNGKVIKLDKYLEDNKIKISLPEEQQKEEENVIDLTNSTNKTNTTNTTTNTTNKTNTTNTTNSTNKNNTVNNTSPITQIVM